MGAIRRLLFSIIVAGTALFLTGPPSMAEFQFPLSSISPVTTPQGEQRARIGVGYNKGERLLFQREDKNRRVYTLPFFHYSIGVSSNVELLFSYPLLLLNQNDQTQDYGSGDLTITGVFKFFRLGKIFPHAAIKIATKLPNASNQEEFGTDETDFFLGAMVSRHIGTVKLLIDVDLAILGDPSTKNTQDDVLEYKVGFIYPVRDNFSAALEIDGAEFSRKTNDRRFLRGGIAFNWNKLLFDAGGALGLTDESGEFQVQFGVTFKLGPGKEPVYYR